MVRTTTRWFATPRRTALPLNLASRQNRLMWFARSTGSATSRRHEALGEVLDGGAGEVPAILDLSTGDGARSDVQCYGRYSSGDVLVVQGW